MSNLAECRVLTGGQWKRKGHTDITPGGGGGTTQAPYWGACPPSGGGGASAVLSKFGTGSSVRVFFTTSLTARPSVPAGVSIMHLSYRPDMAQVASGALDSQIISLINFCQPGWILTFHHEPDNNGWSATQRQDWKNGTNHLYDLTKSTKPSVLTAPVFTGGLMASYTSNATRDLWCTGIRSDLFGVDCDGVHIRDAAHPNETNYDRIQYTDEMDNAEAYMAHPSNSGFTQITVPEMVTARKNPPDPTGSIRAGWFTSQSQIFVDRGVYAVQCYDFDFGTHNTSTDFNELPNPSPELTVWKNLVLTNPSSPRT